MVNQLIRLAAVCGSVCGALCGSPAAAIDTATEEKVCREIGFKPKTEKYANCVLELYERKAKAAPQPTAQAQPTTAPVEQQPQQPAQRGDGSPDDRTCQRYGLQPGTPAYGNCRLQIDMAKQQVAREQARYQAELAAYEEQKSAAEKERKRQQAMRQLEMGLALMAGKTTLQDIGRAELGLPPEPTKPTFRNQTIRLPNGSTIICTTSGTFTNCN